MSNSVRFQAALKQLLTMQFTLKLTCPKCINDDALSLYDQTFSYRHSVHFCLRELIYLLCLHQKSHELHIMSNTIRFQAALKQLLTMQFTLKLTCPKCINDDAFSLYDQTFSYRHSVHFCLRELIYIVLTVLVHESNDA